MHEYDARAKSTCRIIGLIKVGEKKLFLYDPAGKMHEVSPTCVLDFYVHESCQRCGYGKELFDHMLEAEGVQPSELAIDKPSPKFTAFLGKHFNLRDSIPQTNNYLVFREFFNRSRTGSAGGAQGAAVRRASGTPLGSGTYVRMAPTAGVRASRGSLGSAGAERRSPVRSLAPADRQPLNPGSRSQFRHSAPSPVSRHHHPKGFTPRISSISFG